MAGKHLKSALLFTRITIVLFLIPWVILKFTDAQYSADIISYFYSIKLPPQTSYVIGGFWVLLLAAFVTGFQKRISYGLVLVLHAISTASTYKILLNPLANEKDILFMAALPALGAMVLLFVLRDEDTLFTLPRTKK